MPTESTYNESIADQICEEIATSNKGLDAICDSNDDYPSSRTFYRWLQENESLRQKYARARERQADYLADEIIEIADDSSRDTKTIKTKGGDEIDVENTEWVNRSRLRVDARKWKASKLAPKKYGDKIDVTSAGEKLPETKTIDLSKLSKDELKKLLGEE